MIRKEAIRRGILTSCFLGATLAFAQAAPPAAPQKQAAPPPAKIGRAQLSGSVEGATEYTWPNGFRAVLLPDDAKTTIMVNMVVLVGSRSESYGEYGIAHLFEHMLFKRTKRFASIKEELSKIGGRANGTTWLDRTNYFEEFPATDANLNRVIDLEAERLRSAIISRDQLKTEMTVVRNELERGENNPSSVLYQAVESASYQWHNYGKSTIGPVSDIENVPNEKLIAWYETYYQPDNTVMFISGKFDLKKTVAKLDATFGRMVRPKRKLPTTYTVEPLQTGERSVVERRVGGTPLLMAKYHGPALSNPDSAAFELVSSILATEPSGRLYQALVSTDKAASVSCMNMPAYEPTGMLCALDFKPGQDVNPAREVFISTIEQAKPFTDEEVNRAKIQQLSSIENEQANVHALNSNLTEFASSDWRYYFQRRDNIDKLTTADVNRIAKKYLVSSNRTTGEYVPTESPVRAAQGLRLENPFAAIQGYKGRTTKAAGEAFDTSLANIEAHTKRGVLSSGTKYAFLPKKTRGEIVEMVGFFYFGTESSLTNRRVDISNAVALLDRGTAKRSRTAFQDELSKLKAELRVNLASQALLVSLKVPRENLEKTLALVGEMLREPAFDAKEFTAYVGERTASLNTEKDEPQAISRRVVSRALYPRAPNHYLYRPLAGEEVGELKNSTLEKAKNAYQSFIGPTYASVAFVGDFDPQAVKNQLESMFKGWTVPEKYVKIPLPYKQSKTGEEVITTPDKPMAMTSLAVTLPISDESPDYPKLELANYMLGGGFMTGRIPARLREKDGLSYGAGSGIRAETGAESSSFFTGAIYAPQNWEKVKLGFKEELEKATNNGFTEDEFKKAKEGYLQSRRVMFSQDGFTAAALAEYDAFNRTLAFEEVFERAVEKATLAEVNAALKKYISYPSLFSVSVGNYPKAAPAK